MNRLLTWLLITSFFFFEYAVNLSLTVIGHEMRLLLALNEGQFAFISATFILAYSFALIPAGLIMDRFAFRTVIVTAYLLFASATVLQGFWHDFFGVIICRAIMGAAAAFSLLSSLKYARVYFPEHLALMSGLALAIGMLGGLFAKAPTLWLYQWFANDYTYLFLCEGLLMLLCALGLFYCLAGDLQEDEVDGFSWSQVATILQERTFWLIALYGSFMYTPFLVLEMAWSTDFLLLRLPTLSLHGANTLEGLVFIGVIVGALLMGYLSDRSEDRRIGLLVAALMALISVSCLLYLPLSIVGMSLVLLFFGVATGGFMPAFAFLAQTQPRAHIASAYGLMNFLNMITSSLLLPWLGSWIDYLRRLGAFSDLLIYQYVMLVLPLLCLLALVLILITPKVQQD